MTKNARFLQKNDKKSQKIHVFLTQMRPKSTRLRQIEICYPPLFQRPVLSLPALSTVEVSKGNFTPLEDPFSHWCRNSILKAKPANRPKYLYNNKLERFLDFTVCP
jgi:hypothetical protein